MHVGSFKSGEPPIFIAVQNYTAQGNEGIPKAFRSNTDCCAIWKSGHVFVNPTCTGSLVARPYVSRVACASARPSGTTNSATVDAVESTVTPIFGRVRRSRASADCLAARPSVLSDNGGWRKNRVPRLKSTRLFSTKRN